MHAHIGIYENFIMLTSTLPTAAYPLFKAWDHSCRNTKFSSNFKTYAAVKRRGGSEYPADDNGDDEELKGVTRRDFMMQSVIFAALGSRADSLNTTDGRTVVNSILGGYEGKTH